MYKFKGFIFFVLFGSGLAVLAQTPGSTSEEQMQQMMQGAMQMASCFENIDQSNLEAIAAEAEALDGELKALCAEGKRDEAQQQAMAFGQRYADSEEIQQIKACGEQAQGMMPDITDYSIYTNDDTDDDSSRHVCDDL